MDHTRHAMVTLVEKLSMCTIVTQRQVIRVKSLSSFSLCSLSLSAFLFSLHLLVINERTLKAPSGHTFAGKGSTCSSSFTCALPLLSLSLSFSFSRRRLTCLRHPLSSLSDFARLVTLCDSHCPIDSTSHRHTTTTTSERMRARERKRVKERSIPRAKDHKEKNHQWQLT